MIKYVPFYKINWYNGRFQSMHFFPWNLKAISSLKFPLLDNARDRTLHWHLYDNTVNCKINLSCNFTLQTISTHFCSFNTLKRISNVFGTKMFHHQSSKQKHTCIHYSIHFNGLIFICCLLENIACPTQYWNEKIPHHMISSLQGLMKSSVN